MDQTDRQTARQARERNTFVLIDSQSDEEERMEIVEPRKTA